MKKKKMKFNLEMYMELDKDPDTGHGHGHPNLVSPSAKFEIGFRSQFRHLRIQLNAIVILCGLNSIL
jgi:hypothetical protein